MNRTKKPANTMPMPQVEMLAAVLIQATSISLFCLNRLLSSTQGAKISVVEIMTPMANANENIAVQTSFVDVRLMRVIWISNSAAPRSASALVLPAPPARTRAIRAGGKLRRSNSIAST